MRLSGLRPCGVELAGELAEGLRELRYIGCREAVDDAAPGAGEVLGVSALEPAQAVVCERHDVAAAIIRAAGLVREAV